MSTCSISSLNRLEMELKRLNEEAKEPGEKLSPNSIGREGS